MEEWPGGFPLASIEFGAFVIEIFFAKKVVTDLASSRTLVGQDSFRVLWRNRPAHVTVTQRRTSRGYRFESGQNRNVIPEQLSRTLQGKNIDP